MRVVHTGMCKYCPTNSGEVLCHGQDVEALSDLDCCMLAQLFQPFSLDLSIGSCAAWAGRGAHEDERSLEAVNATPLQSSRSRPEPRSTASTHPKAPLVKKDC